MNKIKQMQDFDTNDKAATLVYEYSRIIKNKKLLKEVLLQVCQSLMDEYDPMESNEYYEWKRVKNWINKDKVIFY